MPKFHVDLAVGTPREDDPIVVVFGDEEFICCDVMPAAAMADYSALPGKTVALLAFMRRVLMPDDLVRFEALLTDKDRVIRAEDLDDAVAWLMETYTDRPTQRPSDLSDGSAKNGSSSAAISILKESPSMIPESKTAVDS